MKITETTPPPPPPPRTFTLAGLTEAELRHICRGLGKCSDTDGMADGLAAGEAGNLWRSLSYAVDR